jgi:hypothetical protein
MSKKVCWRRVTGLKRYASLFHNTKFHFEALVGGLSDNATAGSLGLVVNGNLAGTALLSGCSSNQVR